MPALPLGSRPRKAGERSQPYTSEKTSRDRGSSSLSYSSQNASLQRAPEGGRGSEGRRTDTTSHDSPARDRAGRDDRYDRGEGHGRDGSGSYPRSGIHSGTGSRFSPMSKVAEEGPPQVSRAFKEALPSPASISTKEEAFSSASRASKGKTTYSATRPTEEESYYPDSKSGKDVLSPSGPTSTEAEFWVPKSRPSRAGFNTTMPKSMETGATPEEDKRSGSNPGSAIQRLGRHDHGTADQEVNLQTNCFQIELDPRVQLYQYHVNVIPEPKTARQRKQAFDLFLKNAAFLNRLHMGGDPPVVASDHRSTLITTERIDPRADKEHDRHQCIVTYYDAEEGAPKKIPSIHSHIFTVSFCQPLPLQKLKEYLGSTSGRALSKVNGSILHALSLVVARKPLKITDVTKIKNEHRFFPKAEPLAVLDGGLVALQGFQASVRMMGSRLFINVNPRTRIFYREDKGGTLFDLMKKFSKPSKSMEHLQEFVEGIRISLPHLSSERGKLRIKTVSGLATCPKLGASADEASFCWKEKQITVANYYKQRYSISLEASKAPVVNVGTVKKPTYVPPELCKVLPKQMANKPLSPGQQQKIAAALKERREDTISTIGQAAKALTISTKDSRGPELFGLKIAPSVLTMKGRLLPAPPVQYDGVTFKPDFGSWNLKKGRNFNTGAAINSWTYLQIQTAGKDSLIGEVGDFIKKLQKSYASTICKPAESLQPLNLSATSPEDQFATLDRFIGTVRRNDINTLLVILPDRRQTLFACIKYLGDVKYGIQTICIEAAKMQKHIKESWYAATIAQKLNTKGEGINQCLPKDELKKLLSTPTMIVGIDVTTPFPKGQANAATSIIGVVASKDIDYAQWPASVRRQGNPEKVILDLQEMMIERLKSWKKANNGALPDRILIYRNNMTDYHTTVIAKEMKSIEDGIGGIYSGKRFPKMTIITVSKSHNMRFYPADNEAADGQSGNPKVGTVVDGVLTKQGPWDFYLQSHPGTPKGGTVCPAHYVVIKDEMELGADGVQRLTNNLCYTSGRGTRALSRVPPAHYANLVCERARCYMQASLIPSKESRPEGWSGGVHQGLQDSMWYI